MIHDHGLKKAWIELCKKYIFKITQKKKKNNLKTI